jgi:pyruvate dehydrogenase E1 component alpha subunit
MITAYRNHVQPIGMGVDPKRVMAELLGKYWNIKRNGWFYAYSLKNTVLWWSRIVGGQIL